MVRGQRQAEGARLMLVRRASPDDLPIILPLARAFHAESPANRDFPFNDAKVRALIENACFDPNWCALIATDGDELIGFALFFAGEMYFSDAREAADLAFYVASERRGGRAALLLLDAVIKWGKIAQVARINIAPNTGINHEVAGRFFEKFGFRGESKVYSLRL